MCRQREHGTVSGFVWGVQRRLPVDGLAAFLRVSRKRYQIAGEGQGWRRSRLTEQHVLQNADGPNSPSTWQPLSGC